MKLQFLRMSFYALVADRLLPDISFCERLRAEFARAVLGAKIGRGVRMRANVDFGNDPSGITIGDGCYINRRCTLFADWGCTVTLGKNVWLGPEVMLWTGTHEIGPSTQRCGDGVMRPIEIGDGCWLGARVTVLGGVTIGEGSIIGAAALVTRDVFPNCLAVRESAKVLRTLPADTPAQDVIILETDIC